MPRKYIDQSTTQNYGRGTATGDLLNVKVDMTIFLQIEGRSPFLLIISAQNIQSFSGQEIHCWSQMTWKCVHDNKESFTF